MLEANAIRERGVVGREIRRDGADAGIRQIKTRARTRQHSRGARAVDEAHRIGSNIMHAIAGAFVGVGDGATFLQSPFARGRDCTIYAA